jgi:hypothetical protein
LQTDDQLCRADSATIKAKKQDDPTSDMCTEVEIELKEADPLTTGTHSLKFSNPDGQMAVATFPLGAMTINVPEGGLKVTAGVEEAELEVPGANFDEKVQASWKSGPNEPAAPATVSFVNPATLRVKFKPGAGGKGRLVLISAVGLKAIADVNVA